MARRTREQVRAAAWNHPEESLATIESGENPDGTAWTMPGLGAAAFQMLFTSNTLLAAGGSSVSAWFDIQALGITALFLGRSAAGGVYVLEVDWSRDGVAVDVTEAVTPGNNATLKKEPGMRHCRFRVRNTDAVVAFTAHRTTVHGR